MLDLNLEICKTDNANCNSTVDEESGTSNSSIISNPDDQENNFSFFFEILKKENLENPNQELNTQQFFPENSDLRCGLAMKRAQQNQWLKLCSCESELKNVHQKQQQMKKSRRGPRSKSSQYIGVTFYRRTGRWESHIWDCGKQLYLGGFDTALSAARAYDRAAIKFRGVAANINFTLSDYEEDMKQMRDLTKEEFVQILRPKSFGSARGGSKYKGVTPHKYSRLEARLAQFQGKKGCNGREAITEFESGARRAQNLDLSLGIAISGNNLQGNYRNVGTVTSSGTKGLQLLNSLPLSGKLPGYQERVKDDKVESSSWLYQMGSRSRSTVIAASSGFASSSATIKSSTNFESNKHS